MLWQSLLRPIWRPRRTPTGLVRDRPSEPFPPLMMGTMSVNNRTTFRWHRLQESEQHIQAVEVPDGIGTRIAPRSLSTAYA